MKDKPDLTTLLMAMSFLHTYKSFSKDELLLLLTVDSYKNSLMMVPYSEGTEYPKMTQEVKHIKRILDSHTLAYEELLRKMLVDEEFNISPKCSFELRDALRNFVNELKSQEGLYAQTLGEYLNGLGEILFLESEDNDDTKVIRFMAPISDYQVNEEFRYSLADNFEDDVELE